MFVFILLFIIGSEIDMDEEEIDNLNKDLQNNAVEMSHDSVEESESTSYPMSETSFAKVSTKLVQELVDKVTTANNYNDDDMNNEDDQNEPSTEFIDQVTGVTEAVEGLELNEKHNDNNEITAIEVDAAADNTNDLVITRVDFDISKLKLIKILPFIFQLNPQHCRISGTSTSAVAVVEEQFISIEGFHTLPSTAVVILKHQDISIVKEINTEYSNEHRKNGFLLPNDVLTKAQMQANNIVSVAMKLDASTSSSSSSSSVMWPTECCPSMVLFTQMSITGGGKAKPGIYM